MTQRSRNIIAGSRSYDHYAGRGRRKSKGQVVRVLLHGFPDQSWMAAEKWSGEIHDVLIAGMIHPHLATPEISIGVIVPRVLDLLVGRPHGKAVSGGRIMQEQNHRNNQAG